MRLLYSSDLHGNGVLYQELLDLAVERQADAVVVGGDLLPREIALSQAITTQRAWVSAELRPLLEQFRRRSPTSGVYLLAGNDDWAAAIAALDELERAGLARPLHERVYRLEGEPMAGLHLAGYACVPITPFSIKDYERRDDGPLPAYSFEMAYVSGGAAQPRRITLAALAALPSIADDLAALARRSSPQATIYVCHTPPHNTPLDYSRGRHLGSLALRRFIERHQPPLTLHGHIHEAPDSSGSYATRIGTTWCLNPGSDGRRLHAIWLDTQDVAGTLWHTLYEKVTSK
jgi:Icc-related predicted phosphoesterase